MSDQNQINKLNKEWAQNLRWQGIERPYGAEEVRKLQGSLQIEHTLARVGANRLWKLMQENPYVNTLGALTGNQAVQQVQAGLKAIYLSGWQVAGDSNTAGEMYPDQSLYPVDSVPHCGEKDKQRTHQSGSDRLQRREERYILVCTNCC